MYRRVLIPLDGSERAEAILPFAAEVAGPLDAELLLLRVVEPISPVVAVAGTGVASLDVLEMREMEARQYLAALAERLEAKAIRVRTVVRLGWPATEIPAVAVREGVDLIAMSTHGRTGLDRVLFGSVAEAVLRAAPVPVLMIRAKAGQAAAVPGRA